MSIEQARDAKHVDGRSDIYSLGCMLYRFVTGNVPFQGTTVLELLTVKERGKFPPARRSNPEVPERLDLMLDKMLAKDPNHRYQNCAELIKDLESLGLANDTLSFVAGATGRLGKPPGAAGPGSKLPNLAPRTVPPVATTAVDQPSVPEPKESDVSDYWFVRFRAQDGQKVTRKLTAAQVTEMIKHQHFDARTKAGRTLTGKYHPLATYREFQHTFRGVEAQSAADRKTETFRQLYRKIEQEERSWKRWRAIRRFVLGLGSWVRFLLWMALLAGIVFGIYLIWPTVSQWLTAMMDRFTR
jgi:serine/threonine-protein kinase